MATMTKKKKTAKKQTINLWFRTVTRPVCPGCQCRVTGKESVWSWIEYIRGRANLVNHFCRQCFSMRVLQIARSSPAVRGKEVCPQGPSDHLPDWLTFPLTNLDSLIIQQDGEFSNGAVYRCVGNWSEGRECLWTELIVYPAGTPDYGRSSPEAACFVLSMGHTAAECVVTVQEAREGVWDDLLETQATVPAGDIAALIRQPEVLWDHLQERDDTREYLAQAGVI